MNKQYQCTVLLISYNHCRTIARAIESVLEQKSKYNFKIHAFDDGSVDGTKDIIRKYANKYPDIIFPFISKNNQGAQANYWNAFSSVDTDYCILLEGDDFYCNPKKIELQIDALEAHPDCSFCGHDTYLFSEGEAFREYQEGSRAMTATILKTKSLFTYDDFFPINTGGYIPYGSARMIRSSAMKLDTVKYKEAFLFDFAQFYYLLLQGNYYYIDMPMSTYVRTGSGVCSGKSPVVFLNDFIQAAIDFNKQTNNVIADKIYSDCLLQISFRLQLYANSQTAIFNSARKLKLADKAEHTQMLTQADIKDNKDDHLLVLQGGFDTESFYYLCNGGLGHTAFLCSIKDALEERLKGKVVFLVVKEQAFIPKAFDCEFMIVELRNVNLGSIVNQTPNPERGKVYVTHPFTHPESVNYFRPVHGLYSTVRYKPWLLRYYLLNDRTTLAYPKSEQTLPKRLAKKLEVFGDIDKIVLFFPEAHTISGIAKRVWAKKADELAEEGLIVLSCVQDKSNVIKDTSFVDLTAEEAFRVGMLCHSVYCLRNGIAELLAARGKDLHVFYPSHETFFIYSINSMLGRNDINEEIVLYKDPNATPLPSPFQVQQSLPPQKAYFLGVFPVPQFVYRFYKKHKTKLQKFKGLVKWRTKTH